MKILNHSHRPYAPAYPNQADPRYFQQKLLDGVTSAVTGMGILAIFFFLITM